MLLPLPTSPELHVDGNTAHSQGFLTCWSILIHMINTAHQVDIRPQVFELSVTHCDDILLPRPSQLLVNGNLLRRVWTPSVLSVWLWFWSFMKWHVSWIIHSMGDRIFIRVFVQWRKNMAYYIWFILRAWPSRKINRINTLGHIVGCNLINVETKKSLHLSNLFIFN